MDQVVSQFFQLGTVVLACSVFIATYLIRKTVEIWKPRLKKQSHPNEPGATYLSKSAEFWNEVLLRFIPVLLGGLIGLVDAPFLFGEHLTGLGAQMLYGGVVGWFAATVYGAARKAFAKKGINLPGGSNPLLPGEQE